MKKLLALAILTSSLNLSFAGAVDEVAKQTKEDSWVSKVTVSTFGAFEHQNFSGKPNWGAGLSESYYINNTVSIFAEQYTFDKQGGDWLSGSVISRVGGGINADLVTFVKDRLYLSGISGGYYDFEHNTPGFGAGLKLNLRVINHLAFFTSCQPIVWFADREMTRSVLTQFGLNFRY